MPDLIQAGQIVNTHGVKGEVKIACYADSPEFLSGFKSFFIDGEERTVISSRVHKNMLLAVIESVDSVEKAIFLKNKPVFIDRALVNLEPGRYFIADLIGLRVYDIRTARDLGEITDVLTRPANDVYVVQEGEKEHLIPSAGGFVRSVDMDARLMTVETIKGMLADED